MKIKNTLKNSVTSLILGFMFTISGCGGGGSNPSVNPDPNPNPNPNPIEKDMFKFNRVSIAGSSITYGEGYLGEDSYVGYVEKYLREDIADTIGPEQLVNEDRNYAEPMSYQGAIKVYNTGTVLHATLQPSDELTIVYAGSNVKTVVSLEVDGQVYNYTIPAGDYTPVKKLFENDENIFRKAFRQTDERAVKTWKLDSNKEHTFDLIVKEGELHLNFITNHMYYMQNAGVGGFEAIDFLNENENVKSTVKEIIAFDPDLFILESSTNDAKTWLKEIQLEANSSIDAPSTNHWIIKEPVSFTVNGKNITINQNVNVHKGDVVIMGDYNGDIQNMVVGIVATDTNGRTISLSKIVAYTGQQVNEVSTIPQYIVRKCTIKNIATWEDRVKEVIRKLKIGVGHDVTVGIGTSGVPNYYNPQSGIVYAQSPYTPRRLLGYREKGKMLAEENDWFFVDFFQRILKVESGVDINHKWTYGDNTHPNPQGRIYFGEAVKNALQPIFDQ